MSEFDTRQLQLIKKKIELLKKGKIPFCDVIYDIEGLARILQNVDYEWKENFLSYWFDLEVLYAYLLYTNQTCFSQEDENEIEITLNILNDIVDHKLKDENTKLLKMLESPDSKISIEAKDLKDNWLMCPICIDAWQTESKAAMVMCPTCKSIMHNPRYKKSAPTI